jgi:hypothetical protein
MQRRQFAILNLNRRTGTGAPFADALLSQSTPFVFLTGYRRDALRPRFSDFPPLSKPVKVALLDRVLSGVGCHLQFRVCTRTR